jgi:inner membrane protein
LATAVLLVAANAPDVDAITYFGEPFQSFAVRRGITHGLLAVVIWPFVITGLMLAWDRCVRRRRAPGAPPARAGPVFGLAALAVLTHPALDWLNTYGMRWLMPFDGTWTYGDAVFIIDPWIWLMLGSVPFLRYSRSTASLIAWGTLWLLGSVLAIRTLGGAAVWIAGLGVLMAVRFLRPGLANARLSLERSARVLLVATACYAGTLSLIDVAERATVRDELSARGIGPVDRLMVGPVIANPFAGEVIAQTAGAYYTGRWNWLGEPRLQLSPDVIERNLTDHAYESAASTLEAQRFLTWARFPYARIDRDGDGRVVRFLDARFRTTGRLSGPVVRLDRDLRPAGVGE